MALIGLFSVNSVLESEIGSYYTKLINPISIRFAEYPSNITNPYYSESAFSAYKMITDNFIKKVTAYCCSDENSLEYKVLNAYKDILLQKGINLEIVLSDENEMRNAIVSGKADIWLETVPDGATCDKFEYYNSFGKMNYTAVSTPNIDEMTSKIRASIGFSDKSQMTETLMKLVMEQAIECPVYQLQTVTVYNTETIDAESLDGFDDYDGFTYVIPYLEEN
jgi:MarR-like DNA-binding transcriptional regulator SgrR of sgrS sRNA